MGRGKDFRDRRRSYGDEPPDPQSFGWSPPPQRSFDRPRSERPVPSGPERPARVKWFNAEKGFGFVELTDGSGEAFLHISVVEAAGHSALEPGTTLNTRVGQGAKGPQITEIISVDTSTAEPARPRPNRDRPGGGGGRPFERSPSGPAQDVEGQVKWYNPETGFGFVAVEGSRDVFIHRSVVARVGLSELHEGQRLHMKVVQGAKGLEATSIEIAD
ncbi:MAG TPA: cold shock domain-containing protein [Xanthobacteraceae bacterium]|nr:cold shock domain-containing protein [Xanthobacteraceae bacterium]